MIWGSKGSQFTRIDAGERDQYQHHRRKENKKCIQFEKGWNFANLVLADGINRYHAKDTGVSSQNCMQEHRDDQERYPASATGAVSGAAPLKSIENENLSLPEASSLGRFVKKC